ncbi:MAG: PEP-CTERM sorting domain-containing protein [Bryobacteraceae bacterium]
MRSHTSLLSLFAVAATLQGAAFYITDVSSTFAIGPAAVTLGPTPGSKIEIGTGTAAFSTTSTPDGVKPAGIASSVSGGVTGPASFASSVQPSGHLFTIDNSGGTGPVIAPFVFTYSWDIAIGADAPPFEWAEANGFFHITGIDNEILTIGGVPVPEYLDDVHFSTMAMETGGMGSLMVGGEIIVPAGVVSIFSVITDTGGRAGATPEPGSFALLAAGSALLAWKRRSAHRFR